MQEKTAVVRACPRISRAELIRLHAEGLTDAELAKRLETTVTKVQLARRRHKLLANGTTRPGIRRDKFIQLPAMGMTDAELALRYNTSVSNIKAARRRYALPVNSKRSYPEGAVAADYLNGMTLRQVGDKHRIGYATVGATRASRAGSTGTRRPGSMMAATAWGSLILRGATGSRSARSCRR
jgi:hypothetical protein